MPGFCITLDLGKRVGTYEVLSLLGSGGMGEVYRARDTRLNRDVAIKVLPESIARDLDHLGRFKREAQLLAALNHPHIAQVYGFEETDGVYALVMELVEGPTLADRIAQGRISVADALPIARQIGDALEAAHDSGVIHRDLKPANVKVRPDGTAKVLDFGLAKALDAAPSSVAGLTNSPTLSLRATHAGLILGTAAYMSPEQAAGKPVDKRTDIWSFGVVVWEMLTGRQLFNGETISHTLADVLRADIDVSQLPADTPPSIRDLLRRCLDRDVKRRLRDIGEARIAIDRAIAEPEAAKTATSGRAAGGAPPRWWRGWPWAVLAVTAIVAVAMLAAWRPWRAVSHSPAIRIATEIGAETSLAVPGAPGANLALSPNGELFAFVGQSASSSGTQLYVRRLNELKASALAGTDDARSPFFSPDGQWIGFFATGKLKKVSVTGGAAVTICDAPNGRGGAWAKDGSIVFPPSGAPHTALMQVSSAGGTPGPLTTLANDESSQRWPQLLPGGRAVLFSSIPAAGNWDDANIVVQQLPDGSRKVIQRGGYFGRYLASGHLVYVHSTTLFAVPFDLDRLELAGAPVPVVDELVSDTGTGAANLAASENGVFVYRPGSGPGNDQPIVWMDRDGKTTPLRATPFDWSNPRFSPDGTRLAFDVRTGGSPAVWIYDWSRDRLNRLTFEVGASVKPVWTPDGRRIVFGSTGSQQHMNLYWQRADGTGDVQRLTESSNPQMPSSWHPSGKLLAFTEVRGKDQDVMILPIDGDDSSRWKPGKPYVLLNGAEGQFSPDGRWVAYMSIESGQPEVYVRPFPNASVGKWQISTGGGMYPIWSRTRKELFFRNPNSQLMVASYSVDGDTFRAEKPRFWSPGRFLVRPRMSSYDLHPDGNRFALAAASDTTAVRQDKVVFVFNFFDELRRLAPATK